MFSHFLIGNNLMRGFISVMLSISMLLVSAGFPVAIVLADEEQGAPQTEESTADTTTETTESLSEGTDDVNLPPAEDTVIETGDAVSGTDVSNTINTNTTNQEQPLSEEGTNTATTSPENTISEESNQTGTSTSETVGLSNLDTSTTTVTGADGTATSTNTDTVTTENENNANATSTASNSSGTGGNAGSSNTGNTRIVTGNAISYANIANLVNSNFINSEGYFQLLNLFGNTYGDIALSFTKGASCSFLCFLTHMMVQNSNKAQITNDVHVSAETGNNTASSTSGNATIITGNAYAAANIINVINTNIINSDYLAFIMNAFGTWEGDLILPPEFFTENEQNECNNCGESTPGTLSVANENNATVTNNATTTANTGDNEASGEDATIRTGNASASSNLITIANTNLFGSNMMLLYVRTGSTWSGQIFSLPSGLQIIGMADGFIIDGTGSFGMAATTPSTIGYGGSLSATSTNNALVQNNVRASATTGDNTATGNAAGITTGNAYAASNIVNLVNTNIIGRNWMLAILNVFGGWSGNIAFGRPDIWLGLNATAPSVLTPTSESTYKLTYRNNGDAYATNIEITSRYGHGLRITDAGGGIVNEARRTITWTVDRLNSGEYGSLTYSVVGDGSLGFGSSNLLNTSCASSFETDANNSDNCDTLSQTVDNPAPSANAGYDNKWARLEINKRRIGEGIVTPGDQVEYEITVANRGSDYAYNVMVEDVIKNEVGEIISENGWNLGTVHPDEQGEGAVVITYTVQYASTTPAGKYTNSAFARWYDENGNYDDHSGHVFVTVEVGQPKTVVGPVESSGGSTTNVNSGSASNGQPQSNSEPIVAVSNAIPPVHDPVANVIKEEISVTPGTVYDLFSGGNPVFIQASKKIENGLLNEVFNRAGGPWWKKQLAAGLPYIMSTEFSLFWMLMVLLALGGYLALDREKYKR